MVTETREHISSLGDFRFAVTDARRRPFPDNAFNVVMANHMLELREAIVRIDPALEDGFGSGESVSTPAPIS